MYIPLQCATLTALYIEKWKGNNGKAYAPTTLTQLYTDLLLSSLIRYISDHPVYRKCKTTAMTTVRLALRGTGTGLEAVPASSRGTGELYIR